MSKRFCAIKQQTNTGRGRFWLVEDLENEFPLWIFGALPTSAENAAQARLAASYLNAGVVPGAVAVPGEEG